MKYIDIDLQHNEYKIQEQLKQSTLTKAPEVFDLDNIQVSIGLEINGKIVSRLIGEIFFNGLTIKLFSSDEAYRGNGYGTILLKHVEELALKKGCHYIFLETMSFNAPQFYLKNGFEIVNKVENSPLNNEIHYFMFKDIR